MNPDERYLVLDVNRVPMIYRNVRAQVVKCCLLKPIESIHLIDSLLLTKEEIEQYDKRLLDFAYTYEKRGLYDLELQKAFER